MPPLNNNVILNNNINDIQNNNEADINSIMVKEFEQLQKMWIQTLVASTMLQKNNTR